jgi:pyruvate,orthophosphate dikinase
MKKWVYLFSEGHKDMRDLLGGKGAGLAEMTRIGLPVPPGFTVSTEACNAYFEAGRRWPDGLWAQITEAVRAIEHLTGKRFGDPTAPLLLSVRSGAKFSMPGMMDTILNVGMNPAVLDGLQALTGDEGFAGDCYRRFIQMFGHTVKGIPVAGFEDAMRQCRAERIDTPAPHEAGFTAADLRRTVAMDLAIYREAIGEAFPEAPEEQLRQAVEAVFASWFGRRAVDYRNFNRIPHDLGTAVNVMAMVYGNLGPRSATGVAFTRNPATGENELFGEYLMSAQGEDVVAGTRTPRQIKLLEKDLPDACAEFQHICRRLEKHYRDVQDLEFTIEQGRLYILQTRTGKRTVHAAVKIAVDMVHEGLITPPEAVQRIEPAQIDQLMLVSFDPQDKKAAVADGRLLGTGLNASPGAATGLAVFDADTARQWTEAGRTVILIRPETTPDDVHGMVAAKGILTQRGGATSHAAVVARGMGKPCVTGCEGVKVDPRLKSFRASGRWVREGDPVSIDGTTGEVFSGALATVAPDYSRQKELVELLQWADAFCEAPCRKTEDGAPRQGLKVWANADYPRDARIARQFGAQGIGLCRTEHMFFEEDRLPLVHQMILNAAEAQDLFNAVERFEGELQQRPQDPRVQEALADARRQVVDNTAVKLYEAALAALLVIQRQDFEELFEVMNGLPVIIRLIDPPLHEFLPRFEDLLESVTALKTRIALLRRYPQIPGAAEGPSVADDEAQLARQEPLLGAVRAMRETNPMLGMRGIRLGLSFPGIVKMQVRAICEAACHQARKGHRVKPEIMIPLTGHVNELKVSREMLESEARAVIQSLGVQISYKFGTMIEVPRSALTAGEIAREAEFFSFGTNDLTQMTFGYSRDDAEGKFLRRYLETGILPQNPFQTIDAGGVGRLIRMAVREGRETRKGLEVGICGEHGGDPASIGFCHRAGLDYVSCSPYRVLVARLAAAQAAMGTIERDK